MTEDIHLLQRLRATKRCRGPRGEGDRRHADLVSERNPRGTDHVERLIRRLDQMPEEDDE